MMHCIMRDYKTLHVCLNMERKWPDGDAIFEQYTSDLNDLEKLMVGTNIRGKKLLSLHDKIFLKKPNKVNKPNDKKNVWLVYCDEKLTDGQTALFNSKIVKTTL